MALDKAETWYNKSMDKTPFGIIYKATFPNGKVYIGLTTKTLEKRIAQHCAATGDGLPFHSAILKHGTICVVWETIDSAESREELNEKEIYYIDFFGSHTSTNHGYNCTLGGDGNGGYLFTNEDRAKMSAVSKGKPKSVEHRAKIGAAEKGKPKSAKTRLAMSAARKGKQMGENNPFYGKHHDEEALMKIGAAHKGKPSFMLGKHFSADIIAGRSGENHWNFGKHSSEETRAKLSVALMGNTHLLGHKHSEETRAKMSASHSGDNNAMSAKNIAKRAALKLQGESK